ncbi:MAG: choice-of-anchor Q domain-containing protein [bacterium]|nr:choice-of-anchor Q domain-containing protein [bacterium]
MGKRTRWILLVLAAIGLMTSEPHTVQAAGVVGTGTAASCTEAAFDAALMGGGTVTFNCGSAPHVIAITGSKTLREATIIDGGGRITLDGGGYTPIFYNSGADVELRSLVIRNARSINGGAVFNDRGMLTLAFVQFRSNEAVQPAPTSPDGNGGAIYNMEGTLIIANSRFSGNRAARWGGAIFNAAGSVTITNSTFLGNQVRDFGDDGGALANGNYAHRGGDVIIANSQFSLNRTVLSGGAVYSDNGGAVTVRNSTFIGNLASEGVGGAISITTFGTDTPTSENLVIENSVFTINSAAYNGGALDIGVPFTVRDSEITNNRSYRGAGMHIFGTEGGEIVMTTIARNVARQEGGGIYNRSDDLRVLQSLVASNVARDAGGGIWSVQDGRSGFNLRLNHTTLSGNRAGRIGGGLYADNGRLATWLLYATIANNSAPAGSNAAGRGIRAQASIITSGIGSPNCANPVSTASYNIAFPDTSCGISSRDPMLLPLAENGGATRTHALHEDSPAIDGVVIQPPSGCPETVDQRGYERAFDGNFDGVAKCDIGAYEWQDIGVAVAPLTGATTDPTLTPTQPPTATPLPLLVTDCAPFRLTSPRDGLPNGVAVFYWDGLPNAQEYRVIVINESGQQVATFSAQPPNTSLSGDLSIEAVGGGITFTVEAQALIGGRVVCRSAVTLPRESPNLGVPPQQPVQQCGNGIFEPGEQQLCPNNP